MVISYDDLENDEISIYKSSFEKGECFNKTYYYLKEGYIIGKGLKQVNDLLKGLNYEFTEEEQDCFYYIKTKIKSPKNPDKFSRTRLKCFFWRRIK